MYTQEQLINSSLLHRSFKSAPLVVASAKGSHLNLSNGSAVLDACGGAAVVSLGHSNPEIVEALYQQLQTVSYVHTLDYTTDASEKLANSLLERYDDLAKVYFVNSGSEANEAAIKLTLQYFQELEMPSKTQFISRKQSYHGNCLGGLSLSGHVKRRAPFEDFLSKNMHHVSPAYEYRYKEAGESSESYVDRLVAEFEDKVIELGPDNVAGFFAETVVGATTGCVSAPEQYFYRIKQVCEKYHILLILDEVMCGSGRTGTFFAWEQENVVPDITTCGKAISSGYSPLSAVVFTHKVANALSQGSGAFNNGHTYQSYPLSCRAGYTVQSIIKRDNLLSNVVKQGEYLHGKLQQLVLPLDIVGDIRGRGLFYGVEFVQDKHTKRCFDPELHVGYEVQQKCLELGVAVYPGAGTIDGVKGDHILIAPMFVVTEKEIDQIVDVVRRATELVAKQL